MDGLYIRLEITPMNTSYKVTCTEEVLDERLNQWAQRHGYGLDETRVGCRSYSKGKGIFANLNGYHTRFEVVLTLKPGESITVNADVKAVQSQGKSRGTGQELEQSDILRAFVFGCMEDIENPESELSEQGGPSNSG